jgi:hypothetical protein
LQEVTPQKVHSAININDSILLFFSIMNYPKIICEFKKPVCRIFTVSGNNPTFTSGTSAPAFIRVSASSITYSKLPSARLTRASFYLWD